MRSGGAGRGHGVSKARCEQKGRRCEQMCVGVGGCLCFVCLQLVLVVFLTWEGPPPKPPVATWK